MSADLTNRCGRCDIGPITPRLCWPMRTWTSQPGRSETRDGQLVELGPCPVANNAERVVTPLKHVVHAAIIFTVFPFPFFRPFFILLFTNWTLSRSSRFGQHFIFVIRLLYFELPSPSTLMITLSMGDLIILHGFVDLYAHLHIKVNNKLSNASLHGLFQMYGGFVWQQRHCAGAEWMMKVDDDIAIHLRRVVFRKMPQNISCYSGNSVGRGIPQDKNSKW
ncbi:hypothetical protein niasHS_007981 [Heterodera schachtii]|uniref:Hexosyltransferase n=1 Tax=Heterodera schachtii TaxID=97005 RepID=A0ABD2JQ72_HETSC